MACDFRSTEVISITNCYIRFTALYLFPARFCPTRTEFQAFLTSFFLGLFPCILLTLMSWCKDKVLVSRRLEIKQSWSWTGLKTKRPGTFKTFYKRSYHLCHLHLHQLCCPKWCYVLEDKLSVSKRLEGSLGLGFVNEVKGVDLGRGLEEKLLFTSLFIMIINGYRHVQLFQ